MNVEFTRLFLKDLDKINQPSVKKQISALIEEVERSAALSEITNLKKLKGHHTAYRIRIGYYRIGVFINNHDILFTRVAHRKDIYKVFP